MPVNSRDARFAGIEPRCAKASIDVNRSAESEPIDVGDEAVSLVFESIAAIGMSEKEAAYTMGMDPAQLSRVKSRQARLSIDALWRMPGAFWLDFLSRIGATKGINEVNVRSVKAARISELVRLLVEVA